MKKILLVFLSAVFLSFVASCGGNLYGKDCVELYDSHTEKYIALGDSREYVESLLGSPDTSGSTFCSYDTYDLLLGFEENKITQIQLGNVASSNVDVSERLKIANALTAKSTEEDFMNLFPDAVVNKDLEMTSIDFIPKGKSLKIADYDDNSGEKITVWVQSFSTGCQFVIIK